MWYVLGVIVVAIAAVVAWRIYGGKVEREAARAKEEAKKKATDIINKV